MHVCFFNNELTLDFQKHEIVAQLVHVPKMDIKYHVYLQKKWCDMCVIAYRILYKYNKLSVLNINLITVILIFKDKDIKTIFIGGLSMF